MGTTFKQEGKIMPYTNPSASAAIAVDTVILLPGELAVAIDAIAASGVGSVSRGGVHELLALSTDVWSQGDPLWWDPTNVRLTRLCTPLLRFAGIAAAAKASLAVRATVHLNERSGIPESWLNRTHVDTAADLTWAAATHNGMVIHVTADAKTVTLPIGVVGMEAIVVNDVADAGALVTVALNGNETVQGNLTIAATKTANLTKTTSRRGDYLMLRCATAAGIWVCIERRGIWVTS
jgi:predicted RecA/RadA family phage recombinase